MNQTVEYIKELTAIASPTELHSGDFGLFSQDSRRFWFPASSYNQGRCQCDYQRSK